MIALAIDTSTDHSILALVDHADRLHQLSSGTGRRHGRDLIPQLESLLAGASVAPGEIEAIGVGLGPGSYTGTRVGVTAAKTLAYATGALLIGLDSLHAIGRGAPADALRISVIADAQRGELYVADFIRTTAGGLPLPVGETRIEPVTSLLDRLEPGTVVLGPALDSPRIRPSIPDIFLTATAGSGSPRGPDLLAMTREAMAAGRRDNPWLLEPLYLRRSAAEDQWDARRSAARD